MTYYPPVFLLEMELIIPYFLHLIFSDLIGTIITNSKYFGATNHNFTTFSCCWLYEVNYILSYFFNTGEGTCDHLILLSSVILMIQIF